MGPESADGCPSRTGTASCRCVRPSFNTPSNSAALRASVADRLAMYKKYKYGNFEAFDDQVRRVWDSSGQGVADKSTVFAKDFNKPEDGLAARVFPAVEVFRDPFERGGVAPAGINMDDGESTGGRSLLRPDFAGQSHGHQGRDEHLERA